MAGRLTPLGRLIKWVVVPGALACVGYFGIAPPLSASLPGLVEKVQPPMPAVTGTSAEEKPAPSVDISVDQPPPKRRSKTHHRRAASDKVPTSPSEETPADGEEQGEEIATA